MNRSPFPFTDFVRARDSITHALTELGETYAMLTGDTGSGKTALLAWSRSLAKACACAPACATR